MSLKYVCYSPENDLINGNHSIDEHSAQYLASIFLQLDLSISFILNLKKGKIRHIS
jgi:hypothetical protein